MLQGDTLRITSSVSVRPDGASTTHETCELEPAPQEGVTAELGVDHEADMLLDLVNRPRTIASMLEHMGRWDGL